ncbi:MAG: hypothetical protein M9894_29170 [Planctomycetes bacterium]|nr:hypothetical protein [Planctomycetota bacterium]
MNTDDALASWRAEAAAVEGPAVEALGQAALDGAPDDARLRRLAVAAPLLDLAPDARARAVALVRWGLGAGDLARWDAAHAAAELGLAELAPDLLALVAPGAAAPAARGRAAEAFAALAPPAEARARLEPVRVNDPDWAVRRLAGEALRQVEARRAPARGDPFARFRALVRCGRARVEGGSQPLTAQQVAGLGLRLPASYRLFLATACAGGRVVVDDAISLTLTPPATLRAELEAQGPRPDELRRIQEAVWARHVEGERGEPPLDEAHALRLLGERYDRGLVDAELWAYGLLHYEAAFSADDAARARHLVRALDALRAYRALVAEPWEVVDDRLADAEDLVEQEGLRARVGPGEAGLLVVGRWEGVVPLALDLGRPGVARLDPDAAGQPVAGWLAGTLLELLNDPAAHAPGATTTESPAAPSEAAGAFAAVVDRLAQGQAKQAGRAFADALEDEAGPAALEAAAALLCRPDVTPLQAAQLLSSVPMAGDKRSLELAREVLQALPGERAREVVEAAAPHDEDGSQVALLVDAAAGLRKKSHTDAREVAKRTKASRQKAHVRTNKNPFYK